MEPYQCNQCKRAFLRRAYFNSHLRTYRGEKSIQTAKRIFHIQGNLKCSSCEERGEGEGEGGRETISMQVF